MSIHNEKLYTYNGKTQNISQWAREYNINMHTLRFRLKTLNIKNALEFKSKIKPKDLIGKRFGKLTVLELSHTKRYDLQSKTYWKCLCDCGIIKIVNGDSMKTGSSKSCGCESKPKGNNSKYFTGIKELGGWVLSNIKCRARNKNLKYNLDTKYMYEILQKQEFKCALSGVILELQNSSTNKTTENNTASIDRIDSSKGYIKGNVQWVHKRVNIMKNNLSDMEFIEWCELVVSNKGKMA